MKNPPHPGEVVRYECIEALGLSVTAAAAALGVTRQTLSNLINGSAGISPEMALRLESGFSGTAEHWLRMQSAYELAAARKSGVKVKRIAA